MDENHETSEEKIIKYLEDKINESGHNFESNVESILNTYGYLTEREVPYLDKDSGKGRRIDFVASNQIWLQANKSLETLSTGDFRLIIECKDLRNFAWIFFKDKQKEIIDTPPEMVLLEQKKSSKNVQQPNTNVRELFRASSCMEKFYGDKPQKPTLPDGEEFWFESFLTTTKATRYFIEREYTIQKKLKERFGNLKFNSFNFIYFQPLIVFSGKMYMAEHIDNKTKLNPIKFAQLPKSWVSSKYSEIFGKIHFVTLENLPEYLEIVYEHYLLKMGKHGKMRMNIFDFLHRK